LAKLTVGTRLMILVGLLSLETALVGANGLRGMDSAKEHLRSVYENRTVALGELAGVLYDTLQIRRQVDLAEAGGTPDAVARALAPVPRLDAERDKAWARYRKRPMSADEAVLAEQAQHDMRNLSTVRNQVVAAYDSEGKAASPTMRARLDELFSLFHADMVRLIEFQSGVARREYEDAQQEYLHFRNLGLLSLVAGLMLGLGAAYLLIRSITQPLGAAIRAADAVAARDLSVKLPPAGKDQFGQLLRSLGRMQVSLRAMAEEITARIVQLEEMSNALPLGVFQLRVGPDGRLAYNFVARRIAAILGVSADDMMLDPASRWRHVHPDDLARAQASVDALARRALAGEVGASSEVISRVLVDGDTRLVLSTAYASAALPDGAVHLSGYYQDITAQRRAQQLLQGVLDECPSVVFIKDLEGRYLLTNRAFDRLLGLVRNGALGKTDAELFPEEVARRLRAVDLEVVSSGEVREFEEEIPAQGAMRAFRTIKFTLHDEGGESYALCGITNDVTERRATELALHDSEAYNKVLFEQSHVPIVVMDPTTRRCVDSNQAAAVIYGYDSKSELIGKTALDVTAPRLDDDSDARLALELRAETPLHERAAVFEWRHRRPNGEIWDAQVHQTTFMHRNRMLVMVTLDDITLRKRAEQAIRAAKEAAEEAARVKSDFLAIMSHEIRTPLNAVLGNLELLADAWSGDAQRERLRTITTASRSLLGIINDILDFSKMEAGQLHLEPLPFDLVETVEEVLAIFAAGARAKGLELSYSVAPALAWRYVGDAGRIRQVVANLVSNAIKFTEAGSVSVDLRARQDGGAVPGTTIAVTDTGIGIGAQALDTLFDPFTQADSSITRRFGGTGLGLALCKRLVDQMGGRIAVDSVPGLGSRFALELPLQAIAGAEADVGAAPANRMQVVLAAASRRWRAAIEPQLRHWGFELAVPLEGGVPRAAPLAQLVVGDCAAPDGQSSAPARGTVQWEIRATPDGPRTPKVDGRRIAVSCFSLAGLRQALAQAEAEAEAEAEAPSVTGAPPPAAPAQGPAGRLRVLVAEDHPVNRQLLQDQLGKLGHDADFAETGQEALRQFAQRPYDAVLTDLSMPGLDGYGLAGRLREQGASVPIIAITAHTTEEAHRRCIDAGIDHVLTKPFSLAELDAALMKLAPATRAAAAGAAMPEQPRPLPASFHAAMQQACAKSLSRIGAALQSGEPARALAELHSMKGAFLVGQIPRAASACADLEALVRAGEAGAVAAAFADLERIIAQSQEQRASPGQ
jgi:PAS domain S-box-containing protein